MIKMNILIVFTIAVISLGAKGCNHGGGHMRKAGKLLNYDKIHNF